MQRIDSMMTIVVWWDGPRTIEEVRALDPNNKINGNGLYLLVGRGPREKRDQIKYCGITERSFRSRLKRHHKLEKVQQDCRLRNVAIWLGNIEYPRRFQLKHLRAAEKVIIYHRQLKHNDSGKISTPKPTCLISRWYTKQGAARINRLSFLKGIPDVIWYDGDDCRTGNLRLQVPE